MADNRQPGILEGISDMVKSSMENANMAESDVLITFSNEKHQEMYVLENPHDLIEFMLGIIKIHGYKFSFDDHRDLYPNIFDSMLGYTFIGYENFIEMIEVCGYENYHLTVCCTHHIKELVMEKIRELKLLTRYDNSWDTLSYYNASLIEPYRITSPEDSSECSENYSNELEAREDDVDLDLVSETCVT